MSVVDALSFEDLLIPDARGGRKALIPIDIEIERALTEDDLDLLSKEMSPEAALAPSGQRLLSIKHAHHALARLMACENIPNEEISLVTGYSPAYISTLKGDPAFKELLAYYAAQKQEKFVDTLERMKTFGLTVLDELQKRFEENPEDFKKSELLNMTDLFLLRGHAAGQNGKAPAGAGVAVNISFVAPGPLEGPMANIKTIEG